MTKIFTGILFLFSVSYVHAEELENEELQLISELGEKFQEDCASAFEGRTVKVGEVTNKTSMHIDKVKLAELLAKDLKVEKAEKLPKTATINAVISSSQTSTPAMTKTTYNLVLDLKDKAKSLCKKTYSRTDEKAK